MQDTKRRKLNPYKSKFQVGDIVRNIDGGSEYIVVKKDRKNNPVLTLIKDAMSDYNVAVRHIMNSGYTRTTQSKKKKHAYIRCMIKLFKL